jgi:GntR family transcriptional regulator, transcriptional repressor for pyruvate dehydrogenase complex
MLDEYGVGRGTLREAMRVLETCGLISLKPGPGGGPVVESARAENFGRMSSLFFQFGSVTYREVFEARLILEPVAARLAAQRAQGTMKADELLRAAQGQFGSEGDDAYLARAADFHASVIALGDNGVVSMLCQSLAEIYRDRVSGVLFPKNRRKEVHQAHVDIARAILKGNETNAEKLMVEHMQQYTRYLAKRHPALLDEVVRWQ